MLFRRERRYTDKRIGRPMQCGFTMPAPVSGGRDRSSRLTIAVPDHFVSDVTV
jgi:hypothetical protein